ncbi:hypothetical protein [Clostridium perfringens]|uniref:hypothetical protein n=1 Tax=Clostridium perfringens TaxID=1502 RepID=UPI0024BD0156|nr:hypothetical protein [Clostridium perfringens]
MSYLLLNVVVIVEAITILILLIKKREKVKETKKFSTVVSLIADLDFITVILMTWFLQSTLLTNIALGVLIILNIIFIGLSIRKWVKHN